MSRNMAPITTMTQASPPGGGPVTLGFLPLAGLNLAINVDGNKGREREMLGVR